MRCCLGSVCGSCCASLSLTAAVVCCLVLSLQPACSALFVLCLQEVHRSLLDSLTSTVELGHNNSLLVVGDRGSGKTLVRATSCSLLIDRLFVGL